MSTETNSRPTDGAAYSPHNWWGDQDTDDTDDGSDTGIEGTSRADFVAHALLKQSATLLCGETLQELDRWAAGDLGHEPVPDVVTLGDPDAYPPYETVGKNRHARRVNAATGRMNWAESTFVVIADRPEPEFLAVVDEALENIDGLDIPPRQQAEIRERAQRMKRHADALRDTDIMRQVVTWIDHPELLAD